MKYIAITQRVQIISAIHERRDALSQEWASLSAHCGFLPILFPNDLAVVQAMLGELPLSGILLSGGNDLLAYGGDAPERDQVEHFLVDYAIETKLPLLGVCRGMQLLLDHFGTPLVPVENHVRTQHALDNGDMVNSFHSFGAVRCVPPMQVLCRSQDGVVEGVTHRDYPWLRGIMWHPERYHPPRQEDITMIKELFGR